MVYMNSAEGFHFVCGDIVISRDQVSITCSTGLEKGNVRNTVCATGVHCVVHAHIKPLCVPIYK